MLGNNYKTKLCCLNCSNANLYLCFKKFKSFSNTLMVNVGYS